MCIAQAHAHAISHGCTRTAKISPKPSRNVDLTSPHTLLLPSLTLLPISYATATMLAPLTLLLTLLTTYVSATALTYKLIPNEKECFYTHVEKKDAKIAFYFAVQSGGNFDSELFHICWWSVVRDGRIGWGRDGYGGIWEGSRMRRRTRIRRDKPGGNTVRERALLADEGMQLTTKSPALQISQARSESC